MKVYCDDREDGEVIEKLMALGVECEIMRLSTADYIWNNIAIERKTIDDFCLSIIDGRIKKQAERMFRGFKYNYILISGRIGDRTIDINDNCILGMISSLVLQGIHVICVDTDEQLVFLMKRLFERHQEANKYRINGGEQNDELKSRR